MSTSVLSLLQCTLTLLPGLVVNNVAVSHTDVNSMGVQVCVRVAAFRSFE